MTEAEQFELALVPPDPLEAQWRENERRQAEAPWWADRYVIAWWSGAPEYNSDPEGWASQPEYERQRWRNCYEHEQQLQDLAEQQGRRYTKRTAAYLAAIAEEHYQESRKLAESWAVDIRAAFKDRRCCPIIPAPGSEHILDWAFLLAAVPVECLPPAPCPSESN